MTSIRTTATIARSPADLFAYVTTSGYWPQWHPSSLRVRGASDNMEVELTEKQRTSDRVAYELLVRVKNNATPGYFNDELVLVTNDDANPRIPLHVTGRVVPQISVAPEPLVMGDVVHGQTVSKKVIVRGKKPFAISKVESDGDLFQFQFDKQSSDRHVVEMLHHSPNLVSPSLQ